MKKKSWEVPPIAPIASTFQMPRSARFGDSHFSNVNKNEAIGVIGSVSQDFFFMHRAYISEKT